MARSRVPIAGRRANRIIVSPKRKTISNLAPVVGGPSGPCIQVTHRQPIGLGRFCILVAVPRESKSFGAAGIFSVRP